MSEITKAIIPVAGLGTRFLPVTKSQPKEMLNLIDKPSLQYIIEEASKSGIKDILLILGRNKESIVNHFDKNLELELELEKRNNYDLIEELNYIEGLANIYYTRQPSPLGLGHAVSLGRSFVSNQAFAVLLGDELMLDDGHGPVLAQLIRAYEQVKEPVVGVMKLEDEVLDKYGIIDPGGMENDLIKVLSLIEKPDLDHAPSNIAVLGRYILTPDIFDILEGLEPGKNNEIQLTDAIDKLNQNRQVFACPMKTNRFDLGSKLEFIKATIFMALKNPEFSNQIRDYINQLK